MKCDYWLRLPWLLCGLAEADEAKARQIGARAVDAFERDPREEAHHRVTWALMRPGSDFRASLDYFVDGCARPDCGDTGRQKEEFLAQIARFAFFPTAETCIEAKHAKASMALKKDCNIGPVRISLSNRLEMMESMIRRDPATLHRLVDHFETARRLVALPSVMDLGGHPLILALSRSQRTVSTMRRILGKVIYMADVESRFVSLKTVMKAHAADRRKTQRRDLVQAGSIVAVNETSMLQMALLDHMRARMDQSGFFSLPQGVLRSLVPLASLLDEPASKRARIAGDDGDALVPDLDIDNVRSHIFFKVANYYPGRKKVPTPHPTPCPHHCTG